MSEYRTEHSNQYTYRTDISDWWCSACDTVTDYCTADMIGDDED